MTSLSDTLKTKPSDPSHHPLLTRLNDGLKTIFNDADKTRPHSMIHALKTSPIDVLLCLLHCVILLFGLLIESFNELLIKVIKFITKWVYLLHVHFLNYRLNTTSAHHIELNTLTYISAKWSTRAHNISQLKILKRSTAVCGFLFL